MIKYDQSFSIRSNISHIFYLQWILMDGLRNVLNILLILAVTSG